MVYKRISLKIGRSTLRKFNDCRFNWANRILHGCLAADKIHNIINFGLRFLKTSGTASTPMLAGNFA